MTHKNNSDHSSPSEDIPHQPKKSDTPASPAEHPVQEAAEADHAAPASDAEADAEADAEPAQGSAELTNTEEKDKPGPVPSWAKAAIGTLTVIALAAGTGGFLVGKSMNTVTDNEAASYIGGPGGPMRSPSDIHRMNPADPFALGSENAQVVISYFGDLECPVCAAYKRDVEPRIIDEYVNKGQVRLEWNDFPLVNESSFLGAQAGRAAAAQGKFWDFKAAVYSSFEGSEHPEHTLDDFVGFAEQAGVPDIAKFRSDVESGKYAGTIVQAMTYASYVGVASVPTFVINGVPVLGNDYDSLKAAIEQSLKNGHPDQPTPPNTGQAGDAAAPQEAPEGQEKASPETPSKEG